MSLPIQSHPRLLVPGGSFAAVRKNTEQDALLRRVAARLIETADAIIALNPAEKKMEGRWMLAVSRTVLKRVGYLALAYHLTGDRRYVRRAEQEMLGAAAFDNWNPSHFLDVAEMTTGFAVGYDWLYDELTPEARETIREAIVEKGLEPSFETDHWWFDTNNNWNQVCHGGLVLGALAVAEHEPELAKKTIERAVSLVPHAMKVYAPDGAYPEGPSYWTFGTTYTVLMIAALESAIQNDFGLPQAGGFLESAVYYFHVHGPGGFQYNYSDSSIGTGVDSSAPMAWIARRRRQPELLWNERQRLEQFAEEDIVPEGAHNRHLPFALLWLKSLDGLPAPGNLHWSGNGQTPVAMQRTAWGSPDAGFFGIKAGTAETHHSHLDIGSFIYEADGVRWAVDFSPPHYNVYESQGVKLWGRTQDAQRWEIYRYSNFGHNTLVVNDALQRVDGFARIISSSEAEGTRIDMTPVYHDQLAQAERHIQLLPDRSLHVTDSLQALDKPARIRWGMHTLADIEILNNSQARLTQDGKSILVEIENPGSGQLKELPIEPKLAAEPVVPGARLLAFETRLEANGKGSITAVLTPES